ncbi:hypothetical protein EBL_c14100 [Shimwellia blattae DSM 4481 = NBRC 105725]|uniref:Uncharacterized protein n=1 Tax=Shimwellia blattae (strain ATCC 29907 / DSM 4481 / JCM 1650 / NBRC 105725 / CDC 9005-74) TaxID=630626 RepID=I2B7K8_SHIBC|nr:hypothetical protein EBL_c14100 [Shimwellia blattae DSM 4481 = NBRC 105725]
MGLLLLVVHRPGAGTFTISYSVAPRRATQNIKVTLHSLFINNTSLLKSRTKDNPAICEWINYVAEIMSCELAQVMAINRQQGAVFKPMFY